MARALEPTSPSAAKHSARRRTYSLITRIFTRSSTTQHYLESKHGSDQMGAHASLRQWRARSSGTSFAPAFRSRVPRDRRRMRPLVQTVSACDMLALFDGWRCARRWRTGWRALLAAAFTTCCTAPARSASAWNVHRRPRRRSAAADAPRQVAGRHVDPVRRPPASSPDREANLMKRAAERLGFPLDYASRPNATTYAAVMRAVAWLWRELAAVAPARPHRHPGLHRVTCSEEYEAGPGSSSRVTRRGAASGRRAPPRQAPSRRRRRS